LYDKPLSKTQEFKIRHRFDYKIIVKDSAALRMNHSFEKTCAAPNNLPLLGCKKNSRAFFGRALLAAL
jgi:hypothetical protein